MCDPLTIATVSSVVGFTEQQAQADAQNKAARDNYMQQTKQRQLTLLQEQTAASDKLFNDNLKAKEAQSAYLASVEGMGGSVVGRILRDKKSVQARNKANINTNFDNQVQQTQYELEGLRVQADGRGKRGPNLLATGLEIYNTELEYGDSQYEID